MRTEADDFVVPKEDGAPVRCGKSLPVRCGWGEHFFEEAGDAFRRLFVVVVFDIDSHSL
jgi:hypothetical protein